MKKYRTLVPNANVRSVSVFSEKGGGHSSRRISSFGLLQPILYTAEPSEAR